MIEPEPPRPMMLNAIAPSMNSTPSTVVAFVSTVAPARAESRLAPAAAERARHVAPFALLQQHDEQEEQTREHVESGDQVVKHKR